ncbi:MAG: hypothetical protein WBD09_00475 [Halobacteriota archaeon]
MKEYMKELIRHLIYKIIGISHFVRQIEWRSMLKWLDPRFRTSGFWMSHVEEEC